MCVCARASDKLKKYIIWGVFFVQIKKRKQFDDGHDGHDGQDATHAMTHHYDSSL